MNKETGGTGDHGSGFAGLLTRLLRIGNSLAAAPSIHELCLRAVQLGLAELGFERMSIWLVDGDRRQVRGTYGTDEHGTLRDERDQAYAWTDNRPELELLKSPQNLFRNGNAPLRNSAGDIVGMGELGAAALWNGEDVIGLLYVDNYMTRQPISDVHWQVFELYAATLGHLLSLKRTETALRGKEEMLTQILDIMPVGVFVLTEQEEILHYNRAAQELWDLVPETIASWSPDAVWVSDGRPVGKAEWAGRRALRFGEIVLNQEVEIQKGDGSRRVVLNSGVPLHDAAGNLTGAVIVNQDITVSKRREQQLEALATLSVVLRPLTSRHQVLSAIVETIPALVHSQGVAVVLADEGGQGVFEAAAAAYSPLVGTKVPPVLATPVNLTPGALSTPQSADLEEDGLEIIDRMQTGVACLFDGLEHNPRYCVVARLVEDGAAIGAILLGFDQAIEDYTIALVRTLAEVAAAAIQRAHLHDKLTTQAYRLDRVMESANFGLILLDPQRRVVLANRHARVKLAPHVTITVGEELKTIGGQQLGRFLTPIGNEARAQEVNCHEITFEVSTVSVGATGAEGGWLMVIHDVTHDRAIQSRIQQHQRLAAVGQLAAGIAHDFNNIVAVIILYVQMIQRNPQLQASDHHRLDVIREQAHNASKLIRQILDFSRQTVIERQPVDLMSLVRECMSLWQRTLPEQINLVLQDEVGTPALILAEASSLQQAFTNLALNARDAMSGSGELRVIVSAITVDDSENAPVAGLKKGRWYTVDARDTGGGIAPEHLPHIFDPFFTTKEVGKGTGLGLAQVYGIVQQHGGLVTAQSEMGKGTSICLYLPALTQQTTALPEDDTLEVKEGDSETILLVEDNVPAREATTALLEMMGYRVIAATDGRHGLELFHKHSESVQLILSDIAMPGMSGIDLYRTIQEDYPHIRMLMMTGYPLDYEYRELAGGGRVDWLQKPFTVKQLTQAVRRALDRAKTDRSEQEGEQDSQA